MLSRRIGHSEKQVHQIIEILSKEKVEIVFITGDLSTTSRVQEFKKASQFIDTLKNRGIKTIILPGNHDHYTKRVYERKLFYSHFTNCDFPFLFKDLATSLKDEKIEAVLLNDHWCCIAIDVVIPTSLFLSTGLFSEELEKRLIAVLEKIPSHLKIMLICHYPFFCNDSFRKRMVRKKALKKVLEKYNVTLYLHGHTHNQTIANLLPDLPLLLDSGSLSHVKNGSFHRMDLKKDNMDLSVFEISKNGWEKKRKESFSLKSSQKS